MRDNQGRLEYELREAQAMLWTLTTLDPTNRHTSIGAGKRRNRIKLYMRQMWQKHLIDWGRLTMFNFFSFWRDRRLAMRMKHKTLWVPCEVSDHAELSLLLQCNPDGIGSFGLDRATKSEGSALETEKRDSDWWQIATEKERARNHVLETTLHAVRRKHLLEKNRLHVRVLEEQMRQQKTMRTQYNGFATRYELERQSTEASYRQIDSLSSQLSRSCRDLAELREARHLRVRISEVELTERD